MILVCRSQRREIDVKRKPIKFMSLRFIYNTIYYKPFISPFFLHDVAKSGTCGPKPCVLGLPTFNLVILFTPRYRAALLCAMPSEIHSTKQDGLAQHWQDTC